MLKWLKKQHNVEWAGAFKEVLSQVLFWGTPVNFVMLSATFYFTTLRVIYPSIQLWMFVVVIAIGFIIISLVEYKVVVPSIWAFRAKQMSTYDRQLFDKICDIEKTLKEHCENCDKKKEV